MMPSQKELTFCNIFYIRAKVKKWLSHCEEHPDYESFSQVMDDNELINGIDNDFDFDGDDVTKIATDVWLEVLGDNNASNDIITTQQYMELIASKAKGFVYSFVLDDTGNANGLVWQMATMCCNFTLFGDYMSLDTMQRSINKWLWPHMSVTLYNKHQKMSLAGEAIICRERVPAYQFMCTFVCKITPRRSLQSVIKLLVATALVKKTIFAIMKGWDYNVSVNSSLI